MCVDDGVEEQRTVENSEIIQRRCDSWMIGSERFLSNGQGVVEQRAGLLEFRLISIDQGENVQHRRHVGIFNERKSSFSKIVEKIDLR